MATLPQTVTALESVAGRDHATLTQYGRIIREAGLLPRGKRGGGAPQMTADNLAVLMLGIYFADAPKDAGATARRLGAYRRRMDDSRNDFPPVFHRIGACETLEEALSAAIAGVPELMQAFEAYIDAAYEGAEPTATNALKADLARGGETVIQFAVTIGGAFAEMECKAYGKVQWNAGFAMNTTNWAAGEYGFATSDRRVSTSFGLRSLQVAYQCSEGEAS